VTVRPGSAGPDSSRRVKKREKTPSGVSWRATRTVRVWETFRFKLGVNVKTAKALGLTIPPSVLGRAE